MGNFIKCPNGHYYDPAVNPTCPWCGGAQSGANNPYNGNSQKTEAFFNGVGAAPAPNMAQPQPAFGGNSEKTEIIQGIGGEPDYMRTLGINEQPPVQPSNETVILDGNVNSQSGAIEDGGEMRTRRKLVGWLVSYTMDEMGVDFKLYEGKNLVGRNVDCQVTIPDTTVSGIHALILYRAGKFSIRDQQSTQGTFVNDEDIELDPRYLKDGDMIRFGTTIFKLRTSF